MIRLCALLVLPLLAAACGRVTELEPAPGQRLPVKPLMARATPQPNDLLQRPIYARPDRVDELVKKSEPRRADPFDLPPPVGGAAPGAPAGTDPQPVDEDTGPVTPES